MSNADNTSNRGDRTAGVCLVGAATLVVFAMAHHPTSHGGGSLNAVVHGTMIVLMLVTMFGLTRLAIVLGIQKATALLGVIAIATASVANVVAATINGFIAPALANASEPISHDILLLCWESNQAFARLGVFATGVAFVLWSIELASRQGRFTRLVVGLGLLAGLAPLLALGGGRAMDVPTAFGIYSAHAAWMACAGVWLYRSAMRGPRDGGTGWRGVATPATNDSLQ